MYRMSSHKYTKRHGRRHSANHSKGSRRRVFRLRGGDKDASGFLETVSNSFKAFVTPSKPTEQPVVTESPVVTEQPIVAESPVVTESPIATEQPVVTESPTEQTPPLSDSREKELEDQIDELNLRLEKANENVINKLALKFREFVQTMLSSDTDESESEGEGEEESEGEDEGEEGEESEKEEESDEDTDMENELRNETNK